MWKIQLCSNNWIYQRHQRAIKLTLMSTQVFSFPFQVETHRVSQWNVFVFEAYVIKAMKIFREAIYHSLVFILDNCDRYTANSKQHETALAVIYCVMWEIGYFIRKKGRICFIYQALIGEQSAHHNGSAEIAECGFCMTCSYGDVSHKENTYQRWTSESCTIRLG